MRALTSAMDSSNNFVPLPARDGSGGDRENSRNSSMPFV
jgi:hypothetical protein